MDDKQKILKGLECCSDMTAKRRHSCLKECPYDFIHNDNCMGDMARDALELLKHDEQTIESLERTIDKLTKAIAEKPEIVRCKDCKYWQPNTEFCERWTFGFIAHRTPPEWFCADAEVKQNG